MLDGLLDARGRQEMHLLAALFALGLAGGFIHMAWKAGGDIEAEQDERGRGAIDEQNRLYKRIDTLNDELTRERQRSGWFQTQWESAGAPGAYEPGTSPAEPGTSPAPNAGQESDT